MDKEKVKASIRTQEGFRSSAYYDTVGVATVGYGLTKWRTGKEAGKLVRIDDRITRERAEVELDACLDECMDELARHPATVGWVSQIPEPAYEALIEMAYQLGMPRLARFKNMLAAVKNNRWATACAEAMDSKWAKQTPKRALHVMRLFSQADALQKHA